MFKMKNWVVLWSCMLFVLLSISACSGNGDGGAAEPEPAPGVTDGGTALDAQGIYKSNCVSCHGTDLQGQSGPNLQQVGQKLDRDQIYAIIKNGEGGMPAFGDRLQDDEIQVLADWLAEKR
ncbi:cytochrome c-551 [Paenibacillus sp. JCM 10914]|uniref:c-type cytochrome n=1 Tax=Paenibacillus sp. JCM 10914 TaxID=1236974 RepID=UPI0003CC703C|nr:cytochrome c [Paenibacillus sp. JCM 10914]GAE07422.1 membrane-attached cytochrome c550 [Paenibacillus sp. JCM 10914]